MEFPKASLRIKRLREDIQIMKKLWTQEYTDFDGEFYRLKKAINNPKPARKPHPPLIIGLIFGRKLMPRLAAELAVGINIYIRDDRDCIELFDLLKGLCHEYDTDFTKLTKSRCVGVHVSDKYQTPDDYVIEQVNASTNPDFSRQYYDVYEKAIVGSVEQIIQEIGEQEKVGFDELIINPTNLFSDNSATTAINTLEIIAD